MRRRLRRGETRRDMFRKKRFEIFCDSLNDLTFLKEAHFFLRWVNVDVNTIGRDRDGEVEKS